jgi:hypothetical protein
MTDVIDVYNDYQSGELYLNKLQNEVDRVYPEVLRLLGSHYKSRGDGPFYARHLKILATMVSQIRLQLDSIHSDVNLSKTRSEYLYQLVGYLAFPDGSPDLGYSDVGFREFLSNVVQLYFKGSTPDSIRSAMSLITKAKILVHENLDNRFGKIDDFIFDVDVIIEDPRDAKLVGSDASIKILLDAIRPAHTLYRLKYIMQDLYIGNKNDGKDGISKYSTSSVLDSFSMELKDFLYEDFRRNYDGVKFVDPMGVKEKTTILNEQFTFNQ